MKNIIILFFCLCCNLISAHETNEAFFIITQKENTIEVEAEFPWTMRNALIAYNSSLEDEASKTDFENTFNEYIKENLILKNKFGKVLRFQNYQELKNNGHSHQNSYLLVFEGDNLNEVTNTVMFNVYENQVNYNRVTINSKTYITSKSSISFTINNDSQLYIYYLLIFSITILILVYRFYQKK